MTTTSSNLPPVKVAIAGLGFGESVHLPALIANPNLEPTAIWHPNQEKLNKACINNNLKGYSNWNELLESPKVDAIIIATPPEPRFELAKQALEAKKHLLLEKPVAINFNQVAELRGIALNNNLSVAVDFEYRAVPLFMQAKRILSRGVIGEPWLIRLDWLMSSRANKSRPWDWYSSKDKGGGVIGALGTHAFDILHWLCGPTKCISAQLCTSIKERMDPVSGNLKAVTSEDICLSHMEISSLDSQKTTPAQVTLSAVTKNGRGCWIEIYGSKGTLILGSDNQKDYVHGFGLWISDENQQLRNITSDEDLAFSSTWSDGRIAPVARLQNWWANSIHTGRPIIPGLAEGLASQKVCDYLRESASSGQKLTVG